MCTRVKTLEPAFAPPTRPTSRTVSSTSRSNPNRTANVATVTKPALATTFGSSKTTSTRSMFCDTALTGNASCIRVEDLR